MNDNEFYLADAIDVIEEILAGGGEFRLYPKGTSMLPLIVQGRDSVVLKRVPTSSFRRYDIAFYRRKNGQFVLHRIMKIGKDGTFTMCGDNQTALEPGIEPSQLIACVDRIYKGDDELSERSFSQRMYRIFWMKMPVRRAIRFVQRVFRRLGRCLKKKK